MKVNLVPFPGMAYPDIAIGVEVEMYGPRSVDLRYSVTGSVTQLSLPPIVERAPAGELWEHTCFEMFARTVGTEAYDELNLSPSTQWACYSFDAYRSGMMALRTVPPDIWMERGAGQLILGGLGMLPDKGPWRIGLSAVIEETDGTKSYWALAHPPGKPDFHHPDCFALEIPAVG